MRWRGRRQSENIEDRRGQGGGMRFPFPFGRSGGGRIGFPAGGGRRRGGGGIGIVGFLIILALMYIFKIDPSIIMQGAGPQTSPNDPRATQQKAPPREVTDIRLPGGQPKIQKGRSDEMKQFVGVVLAETEDLWRREFQKLGRTYKEPKLVLFSGFTRTRCGPGMSQMGPFYCPLDQTVYVDLSFYNELKRKFGAGGDFAQAYVVAHEVGHHVQTLLGITDKVQKLKGRASKTEANSIQVRMELQADCLAGVWAHDVNQKRNPDGRAVLEEGDIEEALNAASAIGDDQIQRKTQGYVVEDSFTHGSSKQRKEWFYRGFSSGALGQCQTFSSQAL